MKNVEPLIVITMLQSKMESEINFREEHFLEKSTTEKYDCGYHTEIDSKQIWVKEQMDDVDINKVVQQLKSNKLSTYKAQEMDLSAVQVLLKC